MKNLTINDVENLLSNSTEGTLISITAEECGKKFTLNGSAKNGIISITSKVTEVTDGDLSSKELMEIFRKLDPDRNNDCEIQISNNDVNISLTVKNNILSIIQNTIQ